MDQLNLPLQLNPEADFASYIPGPNAEVLAAVSAWAERTGEAFLYLYGPPSSGKTHLLQAACRGGDQERVPTIYLPLRHGDLAPSVLDNLELWELVALDDIQTVAADPAWEAGLFDLFNRLKEAGRRLLISADAPLGALPLAREDLRSRLGSGPSYRLQPLSEADCERLLRESARRRGLDLGADSVRYIMRHCPRDTGYLMALIEDIDREGLRRQRRVSRWLVRQVLDERGS